MTRILLIKTSSMGDIIHTLPALTDAGIADASVKFDWLIEDAFVDIAHWHPLVANVIPIALRRWRKGILSTETRNEWKQLRALLKEQHYDYILDAQGLVKSAFLTLLTKGLRVGLDWGSAREPLASLFYQHKCTVNFHQHAIVRMRTLFSQALGYTLPKTPPDFCIKRGGFNAQPNLSPYVVFLHGTTWKTKQLPESYWIKLCKLAELSGLRVKISGGSSREMRRAERIAASSRNVDVLPRLNITNMAKLLASAKGAIAVDTGFGHLAAALGIPIVSLYGPTNPEYTGALGKNSFHIAANFSCAPCLSRNCSYKKLSTIKPACFSTINPLAVWSTLASNFQ